MVQRATGSKPATRRMARQVIGVASVLASLAALLAFRAGFVDAREWGAICAAAAPPLPCVPRDGLLWLQYWSLWGFAALALGLAALLTRWFPAAVAAVALGAMAVANYNATWGVLGAALGVWAWIQPQAPQPQAPARRPEDAARPPAPCADR